MKSLKIRLFLFTIFLAPALYADIHTSTSTDQGAVQCAVDAASDGDTVEIPAGTVAWTTRKSNTPCVLVDNKSITIKGAGIGPSGTIIQDNTGTSWGPESPINFRNGTGKSLRVTGIKFDGSGNNNAGKSSIIWASGSWLDFRIDHCVFLNLETAVYLTGFQTGVIDHCTYYLIEEHGYSNPHFIASVFGDGVNAWKRPLTIGTSNAIFMEDNYIEFNQIATNDPIYAVKNGASTVFRHNTTKNGFVEVWGTCTPQAGTTRGMVNNEFYENTIGGESYAMVGISGGTGVVFNNTITGDYSPDRFSLWIYRSPWGCDFYGPCDGTNPLDGNTAFDSTAAGAHTGGNNGAVLECSTKSWANNQWVGYAAWNMTDYSKGFVTANTSTTITVTLSEGYVIRDTGTHTGTANATVLTCSGKSWPSMLYRWPDQGCFYIYNVTDGSIGKITANSANTITASGGLSGGTNNTWNTGDMFQVCLSSPRIGVQKDWDTGDVFKITNGYPCLDQVGRWRDAGPDDNYHPQAFEPYYAWGNTYNGASENLKIRDWHLSYLNGIILEGRDFYNMVKPGYAPYTYPHPLTLQDVVDTSSPIAPAVVRDGTSTVTDVAFTYSTTSLAANWNSGSDPDSGIYGYIIAVGTSAGGTGLVGWTSIGNFTSTRTYAGLVTGATYYFSVKAVNIVGLVSTGAAVSDGQCVITDGTPPFWGGAGSSVRDGAVAGVDISTTISTAQLSANWDAATDAESGISGYKYAIGIAGFGGGYLVNWTTLGNVLTATRGSLTLVVGSTYYFSVKSINGAGLESDLSNSNGVLVISTADATAPNPPANVYDGASTGIDSVSTISSSTLSANWTAGTDAESGITGYRYAIGTTAGATNTAAWATIGNLLTVTRNGLALSAGTTYYFSIKSINGNNLVSATAANSNGQYVVAIDTSDITAPPNIAQVRDGLSSDVDSSTSLTQLSANWDEVIDPESGIARYWYAIGTQQSGAGASDTRGWTDNGQSTSLTATGLTLSQNVTYYISVKAENGVGMQSASTATSNGQVVLPPAPPDTSSPAISGISAQNVAATGATIVWTTDELSDSLVEYGRTVNYDKSTIKDIVLRISHSMALANLLPGSEYHFRVISVDAGGNEAASADYTFTTSAPAQPIPETVHAYPNPAKGAVKFRIANMAGGEVAVYAVSGRLIRKLTDASAAEIEWDGKNAAGEKVGRGIYIYKITSTAGDTVTGKIALTK